ncbi:ADP-ribosylation factor GTPase-activating protein [Musa troglodytarum]|uniref:ADP-ribosylation factor GTPase-activating protein n=1 Tax=Musa troglodytarum TaxID=320322 RepID=A0A9E7HLZ7_9LILI|nr:ADP-ribosylation factor GTPase-activating protein [Musa troglodytarum]
MDHLLGLLRVRVVRGVSLAFRDATGSDPYVVVRMGEQKLKTSVKKHNVNPVWNEDLTLTVSDPLLPVKIFSQRVYDKDTFSRDDKMGDAEIDIVPFIEAVKMNLSDIPNGTIIRTTNPNRHNCLAEESAIVWKDGKVVQDIIVRLRNVESGELELQLLWVDIPGAPGF